MTGDGHAMTHIDPRHCGARKRQGGTCARPAGWGTEHPGAGRCKLHGGSTPTGQTAGRQALARKALATAAVGIPLSRVEPAGDPADTLARVMGLLRRVVDHLGDAAGEPTDEAGMLSPRWQAWRDSVRELRTVAKLAIDAGVEERRVKLAEEQGRQLAEVIRRILADLDLTPEQQARVPVVVPRRLREMGDEVSGDRRGV